MINPGMKDQSFQNRKAKMKALVPYDCRVQIEKLYTHGQPYLVQISI